MQRKYKYPYGVPAERILRVLLAIYRANGLSRLELQKKHFPKISEDTLDRDLALLKEYQLIKPDRRARTVDGKTSRLIYIPNWATWSKGKPTFAEDQYDSIKLKVKKT